MLEHFLARRPGCQKHLRSIFLQALFFQPHRSAAASVYRDSAFVSEASPSGTARHSSGGGDTYLVNVGRLVLL